MSASSAGAAGQASVRSRQTGWRDRYEPDQRRPWWRHLLSSAVAAASLGYLILVAAAAGLAPLITEYDPTIVNPVARLQGPSAEHWLGTDDLGRDVFSRLLYGARVSLLVGISVTGLSALIGVVLGLLAGYYQRLDGWIMRFLDGVMAFPGVLLAIAIVVSIGARPSSVVLALTFTYAPVVARLVRSTTLVVRHLPYVEAGRAIGLRDRTILWRYILANSLSPLIVQCTFIIAYAIIAEASLSYLGASIDPETATWGNMLRDGQRLLSRAWWIAVFPGIALFLTVLAFNVLGDGLRDALDPRRAQRQRDGVVR